MDYLAQYTIQVAGLKNGMYSFEYKIVDEFFKHFKNSEIQRGQVKVKAVLTKTDEFMSMQIVLKGKVEVQCDRCLDYFFTPVKYSEEIPVCYGIHEDLASTDEIRIAPGENEVNLAPYFFEFIILTLPIRKTHPSSGKGVSQCDPEMLKQINDLSAPDKPLNTDPRWDKLKDLTN